MRQEVLVVLTAADWLTLRQGVGIPFRVGDETVTLVSDAWLKPGSTATVSPNGAFLDTLSAMRRAHPLPVTAKAEAPAEAPVRRKRQYAPRKTYTTAQKRKVVADFDKAAERGETIHAVLTRHGMSTNSGSPYIWRKQFEAEKKKKGA